MNKWFVLAALLALGKMLQTTKQTEKKGESPCPAEKSTTEKPGQTSTGSPERQAKPAASRPRRRYKTIDGVLHEQNPLGFGWREVGSDPDEPYWVRRLD